MAARDGHILTACYDSTVNIFTASDGAKMLTIPGHSAPAGAVAWISLNEDYGTFASAAHDQVSIQFF